VAERDLVFGYQRAIALIVDAGFASDIDWAEDLAWVEPDARYVMAETAWVICCSGFRVAVVRKLWPELTAAFLDWKPALIAHDAEACWQAARQVYKYSPKIDAIVEVARILAREGHEQIVRDAADPPKLTRLPYIGKITCWHLAKVLGADVVKPDVHLCRAARAAGFEDPIELCRVLSRETGDRLTVIDSVLWRYGEQQKARGWPAWAELWGKESIPRETRRGER
jgi:hypothetical protein